MLVSNDKQLAVCVCQCPAGGRPCKWRWMATACCRDSVTGVHAWRRGYLLIWRRCYGHAASAADQCASLLDEADTPLNTRWCYHSNFLPDICRSLCCSYCYGKKKASLDTFFGESVDVSILKTSCRRRLLMLLTITSRTDHYQYFAFLFGIASLQINIWSIRTHNVCAWVFVCITCLQIHVIT